jgi:predicted nucleotidyltransferase
MKFNVVAIPKAILLKIRNMIDNIKILSELKNHLIKNYGEPVNDVILFGSQILGNSNEFSDYDVLIVLENDYSGKDENEILDLCYDIDLKYNILLDVHLISIKELTSVRGRQAVFINAIKSGIHA